MLNTKNPQSTHTNIKFLHQNSQEQQVHWQVGRRYKENNRKRLKKRDNFLVRVLLFFIRSAKYLLQIPAIKRFFDKKSRDIRLRTVEIDFPDLPDAFDGYRILHFTDLHLDSLPGIEDDIVSALPTDSCDLAVFTGDYQDHYQYDFYELEPRLQKITTSLSVKDGILAVLGNHDSYQTVPHLHRLGITTLINETAFVEKEGQRLFITGLDDINTFSTSEATEAIAKEIHGFKILMVHSPEAYEQAYSSQYQLYLCGHTHGGQICLPNGTPIFTHCQAPRSYCHGRWNRGSMEGYTNRGAGVSTIPARLNCPGEVVKIILRKKS